MMILRSYEPAGLGGWVISVKRSPWLNSRGGVPSRARSSYNYIRALSMLFIYFNISMSHCRRQSLAPTIPYPLHIFNSPLNRFSHLLFPYHTLK